MTPSISATPKRIESIYALLDLEDCEALKVEAAVMVSCFAAQAIKTFRATS